MRILKPALLILALCSLMACNKKDDPTPVPTTPKTATTELRFFLHNNMVKDGYMTAVPCVKFGGVETELKGTESAIDSKKDNNVVGFLSLVFIKEEDLYTISVPYTFEKAGKYEFYLKLTRTSKPVTTPEEPGLDWIAAMTITNGFKSSGLGYLNPKETIKAESANVTNSGSVFNRINEVTHSIEIVVSE